MASSVPTLATTKFAKGVSGIGLHVAKSQPNADSPKNEKDSVLLFGINVGLVIRHSRAGGNQEKNLTESDF